MLDIINAHATKNLCYIAGKKMQPKGIVVHSTGANNPYLKRYVDAPLEVGNNVYGNHWNVEKPDGQKVCVHAFIGYDKDKEIRIAEILPLTICCWGVGKGSKGSYNDNPAYIQFEICEDDLLDKTYYEKAFSVAVEYCAQLCRTYRISTTAIVGHCEAYQQGYGSNHSDPEHWMQRFGQTMDDFREQVSVTLKRDENVGIKFEESVTKPSDTQAIGKNDLVAITSDAVYYDGSPVPSWVRFQRWYVKDEPIGDRVVIDVNEKGTNAICSPIHKKYLTIVKTGSENDSEMVNVLSNTNVFPYLVKVVVDSLNIRKEAGTNNAVTGVISDRGVYTIVKEKNAIGATKWGKLKSGDGWISLDYVKKV